MYTLIEVTYTYIIYTQMQTQRKAFWQSFCDSWTQLSTRHLSSGMSVCVCVCVYARVCALQVVHDAEDVLAKAQQAAQQAADQLSLAKLTLREQSGGGQCRVLF